MPAVTQPLDTTHAASPAQSAATAIQSGTASQSSITADEAAFQGSTQAPGSAAFWARVDTSLQANGNSAGQAHDSIRSAQARFDQGSYDVGQVSDELAQGHDVDTKQLQSAVNDYIKETGRTAADFYMDLTTDLHGVNGVSMELATQQANQLAGVAASSSNSAA